MGETTRTKSAHPVDKGWAWVIMIASFAVHFLCIGFMRSFGVLFVEFQRKFESSGAMTSTINGIMSVTYSVTTLLVMNVVLKRTSVRNVCLVGSVLQFLGMSLSSLATEASHLIATQGLLYGCGHALLYCPVLVILSQYFDKKRPIATVISTCGTSAGGIVFPIITRYLVEEYGLRGALLLLACFSLQQATFVALITPPSDYYFAESLSKNEEETVAVIDEEDILEKIPLDENFVVCSIKECDSRDVERTDLPLLNGRLDESSDAVLESGMFDDVNENDVKGVLCLNSHTDNLLDRQLSSSIHSRQFGSLPNKTDVLSLTTQNNAENGKHTIENGLSYERTDAGHQKNGKLTINGQTHELAHNEQSHESRSHKTHSHNGPLLPSTRNIIASSTSRLRSESESSRANNNNLPHSLKMSLDQPVGSLGSSQRLTLHESALHASSIDLYSSLHSLALSDSGQQVSSPAHPHRRRSQQQEVELPLHSVSDGQLDQSTSRCHCMCPDMAGTWSFWVITVFFVCGGVASGLPSVFLPPLAVEKGLGEDQAALLLTVSAAADIVGRVVPGLILHLGFMRPSTVLMAPLFVCGTLYHFTSFLSDLPSLMALAALNGLFTATFWAMQG
ncbi:uncharacterized protein LOC101856994 [Aplysia californica]|uniref:Uncharacterized protein LOC101856994 n=1 Tax=Aplysia californica TaxID=6500 RepID=A0ABM1VSL1_APLCA|nr:uncharacterized protein LOC101856994 [Aplysia californica]